MQALRYDEQELIQSLDTLPPKLKAVFAAACAQRLLPAYGDFTRVSGRGDPARLGLILERLWSALGGTPIPQGELAEHMETCMTLIPAEDDAPWFDEQAGAEDAGAAVAYALRTFAGGKSEEAAYAARRGYEAIDHHLTNREGIDPAVVGGEERLRSHPLTQAELSRQRRDLEELRMAAQTADTTIIEKVRARAVAEAPGFFGAQGAR